jgi:cell wall-associated NlpC family hydrolase
MSLVVAAMMLGGCGTAPLTTAHQTPTDATAVDARRIAVVRVAQDQLGTPYRYGGNRPGGFDCSGLAEFAHGRVGIDIPRTAADQWRHADRLGRDHLLPGDLVFFSFGSGKPRHVGIYEGDGRFIHAPSSGKTVSRDSLDERYWRSHWVGSRTYL